MRQEVAASFSITFNDCNMKQVRFMLRFVYKGKFYVELS